MFMDAAVRAAPFLGERDAGDDLRVKRKVVW
jgi:hypothetical protein